MEGVVQNVGRGYIRVWMIINANAKGSKYIFWLLDSIREFNIIGIVWGKVIRTVTF